MRFFIAISCFVAVYAENCKSNYKSEIIKDGIDRPYSLAIDKELKYLYFSYDTAEEDIVSKTARLHTTTIEFKDIVPNGFAQTVDENTHTVFIGTDHGLLKYDPILDSTEVLGETDTDIWTVYFNKELYYSTFPSQFLYTYKNESTRFKDLEDTKVDNLVIDNDGVIFFSNATGLYSQNMGDKNAFRYNVDNQTIALAVNTLGDIYACFQDGIYKIDEKSKEIVKEVDIDYVLGFVFDGDNNIIYSNSNSLNKLTSLSNCNIEKIDLEEI